MRQPQVLISQPPKGLNTTAPMPVNASASPTKKPTRSLNQRSIMVGTIRYKRMVFAAPMTMALQ